MYLASSWTTFEHNHSFTVIFYEVVRVGQFILPEVYGRGIESFLLCVLGIALSFASIPIASHSVASSLYAGLLVALTTVHFDGTSNHSLHTSHLFSYFLSSRGILDGSRVGL